MFVAGIRRYQARLLALLVLSTLAFGVESVAVTAASPTAAIAKKCKKGKKGKKCHKKKKATKPVKPKISLTNCPTADLTPNGPYTFTGRVVPGSAGMAIVIQYYDQGSTPLAQHTVTTTQGGSFSDTYAYPPTGVRRGGRIYANLGTTTSEACLVNIAEM